MATLTQNVVQWTLPGGDVAQLSIWVEYTGSPTAAQALARFQTNVVDTIWPSGAGGLKPQYEGATILSQVETRVIDKLVNRVLTTAKASYSRAGTGSGNPLPGEVSPCVTLRTALAGGSHRGRFYLPATRVATTTTTGRLDATILGTMLTNIQAALVAMNADVTFTLANVVIYSRTLTTTTEVITVELGDVFDAQRRRRNSLVESRTSAAV